MSASFAGGLVAIVMSYFSTGGKVEVLATINGVLGSLVGITASMTWFQLSWLLFLSGILEEFFFLFLTKEAYSHGTTPDKEVWPSPFKCQPALI